MHKVTNKAEEILFWVFNISASLVLAFLLKGEPAPVTPLPPPQGCEPLKSIPNADEVWFCPPSTLVIREKEENDGVPLPLQPGLLPGPQISAPFAGGLYPETEVSGLRWSTYSGSLPTDEEGYGF